MGFKQPELAAHHGAKNSPKVLMLRTRLLKIWDEKYAFLHLS